MGERTEYAPGIFSWTDLSTTDPEAAKRFYAALFGWQAEDLPVPGGGVYSMQQLEGKNVAAIAPQPPQQREAGVPPAWQSYITVTSADDAARRAGALGGTVHAQGPDGRHTYRIVGRVVLPKLDQPQPLANGAVLTADGLRPLLDPRNPDNGSPYLVARISPRTSMTTLEHRAGADPRRSDLAAWYLQDQWEGRVTLRAPNKASFPDLARVHTAAYLESLK